jgi:putative membrane protein insertion efficiency factor
MRPADADRLSIVQRLALAAIRGYKLLLSQQFAGSCRYVPSCSEYAAEAIVRHGAARGTWLAVRRLGRCHPLGSSGLDPVPPSRHLPTGL